MDEIRTIFFDLGDTLGVPVISGSGDLERIDLLHSTVAVLEKIKGKHIPMGIISNTGAILGSKMNELLQAAGILKYFNLTLLIYSADVDIDKSSTKIFVLAANRAHQPERNCLFVGENAAERQVAMLAGFSVCADPLQVEKILASQSS